MAQAEPGGLPFRLGDRYVDGSRRNSHSSDDDSVISQLKRRWYSRIRWFSNL